MPLAVRIDDGDRRPQAVPPHLRVPVVERSWAQAHLFLALSEFGCRDNTPDSFFQDLSQVPFSQHDHMIQTVTPDGSDQPFHVGPLPGTCWRGEDFLYAQALDSLPKVIPIDLIPVSQQVTWRLIL